MYKNIIRPLLFIFNPEFIHIMIILALKLACKIPGYNKLIRRVFSMESPLLKRNIGGLEFKNPVGLAAGFDKNGEVFSQLSDFGFGFVEIGTVTPKPQPGNPKPRIFRLKKDNALINRMGFNNYGVKAVIKYLKNRKQKGLIIGGNIGKNKITPLENAIDDYNYCFKELYPYVDYFTLNVSSPNTPELRKLQQKDILKEMFDSIIELNNSMPVAKPIFIKIAPDLEKHEIEDISDLVNNSQITGVIATNTTIRRENLSYDNSYIESLGNGGLSGKPLRNLSTEIIVELRNNLKKEKIIIGVGGIMSSEDALEKITAGADLLQIYTGFIYEGPVIIKKINKVLVENMRLQK